MLVVPGRGILIIVWFANIVDQHHKRRRRMNQHEYLMIQDSLNYDEQDVELGMDTYYLEVNDQSKGGYGGIDRIELDRGKLKIGLNKIIPAIFRIRVHTFNLVLSIFFIIFSLM